MSHSLFLSPLLRGCEDIAAELSKVKLIRLSDAFVQLGILKNVVLNA